jgi:GPI inositol-deacylase
MGGIVARSLLASTQKDGWDTTDIAAVITMSTPHSLAPARFDHAIDKIYADILRWENSNKTTVNVPTLAICGGSTDALIPSETCALPDLSPAARNRYEASSWYRWTAYTTSLPGIWSGIGHREMVWCHQVRWRTARTALELGALSKASESTAAERIISRWFPSPVDNQAEHEASIHSTDGLSPPRLVLKNITHTIITAATFRLPVPTGSSHAYLLPATSHQPQNLTLLIAKGVLAHPPVHSSKLPHHQGSLRVSLYFCPETGLGPNVLPESCLPIGPGRGYVHLIPLPTPGRDFPDSEGVDESEGIVFWSGDVTGGQKGGWVAFMIEGGADSKGTSWMIAGFDQERSQVVHTNTLGMCILLKT